MVPPGWTTSTGEQAISVRMNRLSPPFRRRMAAFVVRDLDDFGAGKTVREAMADLGLQRYVHQATSRTFHSSTADAGFRSERDVLPGMEVRLLPHQIIGVSWYVCASSRIRTHSVHLARRMLYQETKSGRKGGIMACVSQPKADQIRLDTFAV
jgi:hypothetical protein